MILAVDPGINGALATYDGDHLSVVQMPTYVKPAGQRQTDRRFIDEAQLVNLIGVAAMRGAEWFVQEAVGGIPGQAAHSAFVFGRGAGVGIGAAISIGLQIEEVHAARWKGALQVPADKKLAVLRADALLPQWCSIWAIKRNVTNQLQASGMAEAALLALYAWQIKGDLA